LCPGLASYLFASLDTYWHSAHSDHNCSTIPPHQHFVHCCSFVVAAVQSEETESWDADSVAEEFEIPTLQLAFFAADPDKKLVLEKKNHHGTSYGFLELECVVAFSFDP
jgi:hypothetical protein